MIHERLAVIDHALLPELTPQREEHRTNEAQREAHKLAGSLDMFGLTEAADIAGELEGLLQMDRGGRARGQVLAARLRGELERAFADSRVAAAEPTVPPMRSSEVSAQILIADDDDIMAKMIESALRHQGYDVVRARDGAEAVGLATDRQFDLILLDLQMPVMDGFDACQTLRLNPRLNDIPIVLLTAQSHETKLRARRVPGVTDYLLKPFGVTELRANVRDWLTRKSVPPGGSWEAAPEPLFGPRVPDCSSSSRDV